MNLYVFDAEENTVYPVDEAVIDIEEWVTLWPNDIFFYKEDTCPGCGRTFPGDWNWFDKYFCSPTCSALTKD